MSNRERQRKTTTIGVPFALKKQFESLKSGDRYKSFSAFCNMAIIQKIDRLEKEEKEKKDD